MGEEKKQKRAGRKQQSVSLGIDTIEAITKESERRGVNKSQLIDKVLAETLLDNGDESKPTVIAVMSYKGGVAKTTTASSLAVCLGKSGYKVLVIDLDGQGNVSQCFKVYDPRSEEPCIADVMYQTSSTTKRLSLNDVMKQTEYEGVDIVPSNFRFADADSRMKSEGAGIDSRLRYAIEDLEYKYDYIIIDCGPRLDVTTTNAIVALEAGSKASHIIIPVKIDGYGIAGVAQTIDMINRTARDRRSQPQPWKILRTLVEGRTTSYRVGLEALKEALPGAQYFNAVISKSTVVPESTLALVPLVAYDPNSKPAKDYESLAREIETMGDING